jgi:hypothetical protein
VAALYFVIATTGDHSSNDAEDHYLCVDNTEVGAGYTSYDGHLIFSTVHAVLHVTPGQRVWVKADGSVYYNTTWYHTMFSGFLVAPDF